MDIWEDRQADIIILAVHGKLDAATSPLFEAKVQPMIERGDRKFVIDCTHLEYISSAALRRLLIMAKAATGAGGKVVLHSLEGHIREIFDMAGFTQLFPIYSSRTDAVLSF